MCRNLQAWFLAEHNQPATSFPLSDSVALYDRRPRPYPAKPARIRFGSGCLRRVLAKRIRSGSRPVSRNHPVHFRPMLLRQSRSDANPIQHVCWGSTVDAEIKAPFVGNPMLTGALPLKPGAEQEIATHCQLPGIFSQSIRLHYFQILSLLFNGIKFG